MTLLEVMLAIAVAGFVLYSATAYVVSISNIWTAREERHFFEDHVDGVTEFLRASFQSAGHEIALSNAANTIKRNQLVPVNAPTVNDAQDKTTPQPNLQAATNQPGKHTAASYLQQSATPISWEKIPGAAGYEDPLLSFKLADIPLLLTSPGNRPATKVVLYLYFDEQEGLSLLWHSNLQEEVESIDDLQRSPVSKLITSLEYIYWDETFEKWEEEMEPLEDDNGLQLPRYLKLTFTYKEETKTRLLPLPVPMESALLF